MDTANRNRMDVSSACASESSPARHQQRFVGMHRSEVAETNASFSSIRPGLGWPGRVPVAGSRPVPKFLLHLHGTLGEWRVLVGCHEDSWGGEPVRLPLRR